MRLRSLTTLAVAVAATFTASACVDESPAAPKADIVPHAASRALLGAPSRPNTPLLRATPLTSTVTVSKTIGVEGGTLSIPEAGLTVVVPPLAVNGPTYFQVTARPGSQLAYDFEPHGLTFATPLVVTQNLRITQAQKNALNLGVSLGYYPDRDNVTNITEWSNVIVDLVNATAVSNIWHFSGYIYASGRADSDEVR